jgi:hydroxymethylpyrimidine/phosphomethylpyrimidine kinase
VAADLRGRIMTNSDLKVPVVMCFAGLDPTGGAGLQADIEAIASMGCHAAPVITAVTVQDTIDVQHHIPVAATSVIEQARAVLEDIPVAAFKLGVLGSLEAAEAIHSILVHYPGIPIILDPILSSGGGSPLADDELLDMMVSHLFPLTTVLTPNTLEARLLAPEADTLDAMAQELMSYGCEFVLLTGTHEATPEVINTLYTNRRAVQSFSWQRLPASYHGSGCTLAAAISGLLAQGREPYSAIYEAQKYTWETLKFGYQIGRGQHLPDRLFWARNGRQAKEN